MDSKNNKFNEWRYFLQFIIKQIYSTKKSIIKYSHRRLASGSRNYGKRLIYLFYLQQENNMVDYGYFLIGLSSTIKKNERITVLQRLLQQLDTPLLLIDMILKGLANFYNSATLEPLSNEYMKAVSQQDKIEWGHVARE